MLEQLWQAVGGPEVELRVVGSPPVRQLPSTLPVAEAAVAFVGAALRAAVALDDQPRGSAELDAEHVGAAVRSERLLRLDGKPFGDGFAPLSKWWRSADGWIRTHANYPWHRAALSRALDGATEHDQIGAALGQLTGLEAEQRIVEAGGVAAALRTPEQWLSHPQGRAVADQPLISNVQFPYGEPRRRRAEAGPAAGLRVLDLTRVIAGPVATRYLAALGADVLRLDPPALPELELHRYDGLPGKHSALLDAGSPEGSARLRQLLADADVVVHGYRPGVLARFGLDGEWFAKRNPGLVVVAISAWGSRGPWGDRRGFDSIVQVATGIAARESSDGTPGALPCQLLDHGTGYLCAAAALDAVRRQRSEGGSYLRQLSLARTAHWLLGQPPVDRAEASSTPLAPSWLSTLRSEAGPVTAITPPGILNGTPLSWPDIPISYGTAPAQFVRE